MNSGVFSGRPRVRRSRGQSLVEFAIALPILLWLFSGILDFGRAYYFGILVTDASRDGARVLISNTGGYGPGSSTGCSVVKAAVADADASPTCPSSSTSPAAGKVVVGMACPDAGNLCVGNPASATHDQPITVDVYYGFQPITPLISSIVPGGLIKLHGHTVMNATW